MTTFQANDEVRTRNGKDAVIIGVINEHQVRIRIGDDEQKIAAHLLTLVNRPEEEAPPDTGEQTIFSTAQAAAYLGYTTSQGLQRNIYPRQGEDFQQRLVPDGKLGREIYFTKATLDHFKQKWLAAEKGLTRHQAAARAGKTLGWFDNYRRNGRIAPIAKDGRKLIFSIADVCALIALSNPDGD